MLLFYLTHIYFHKMLKIHLHLRETTNKQMVKTLRSTEIAIILSGKFLSAFFSMKITLVLLKFHCNLVSMIQLAISYN